MTASGSPPVDTAVVGDRAVADALAGQTAGGRELRVATVPPDAAPGASVDGRPADCLVVDATVDGVETAALVERVRAARPAQAVVLLVGGDDGFVDGLAAGATTAFPRARVDGDAGVLAGQVAAAADRAASERELDELERTYRELFEGVSDGLVVHDPETGTIRDVNERYCELTGYDRAELLAGSVDLVVPEDGGDSYEDALEHIRRAREEGPQLFEFEAVRADGEPFVGEVHLSVVELRGEERVLASVRDVTERVRREREFEQIFHGVEDAIAVMDPDSLAILDANEAYLDLLGYDDVAALSEQGVAGLSATGAGYTVDAGRAVHERVAESGDPETVEWQATTADGERRWLEVKVAPAVIGGEDVNVAIHRDVTERRRTERRLEAILDRIDEAVFVTRAGDITDPSASPEYVSSGYEDVWGRSLAEMTAELDDGFFDTLHPEDRATYRAFVEGVAEDVAAGTAEDRYSHEYRIERPDGDLRWVRSDCYPTPWETGPTRVVVVSRDVTDRKRRERRIASFEDATEGLTTADSPAAATRTAVEAAVDALALPAVGAFLYDDEDGVLRSAATAGAFPDGTAPVAPGDGPLWEAFATGTVVASDGGAETATPAPDDGPPAGLAEWRGVALGSHGLLVVGTPSGSLDPDAVQAAHVLAATLEAALNHLRGQQRLSAREAELASQTERADRLDRIARLTQQVEAAITAASDAGEVERAVCERLATAGPYDLAWVGGVAAGADRIDARAVAGTTARHVGDLDLQATDAGDDDHPAARAWRTGEAALAGSLVDGGPAAGWRRPVLAAGVQSLCAVPLRYDGVTHGVLTVGADTPHAFGERERAVLEQLGTSIGNALAAIERRRTLESDETVELAFGGDGAALPFARAAAAADCRVRHERTVPREDGATSVYYRFETADAGAVARETLPGDVDVVTADDGATLVETRPGEWFGAPLAEYGAVLREATATPEEATLVVEVSAGADVRSVAERVDDVAPSLELSAKRQHHRRERSPRELGDQVVEALTDRQHEVLREALSAGYFEWPRENDGGEVADRLDITQPTLNKHLRTAERTTFELLFGEDDPDER